MRHVVLYEPDPSGHRMVFVRYIAEAMARHGEIRSTLVTSARAAGFDWVAGMAERLQPHLRLHVVNDPSLDAGLLLLPTKLAWQIGHIRRLRSAVHALREKGAVDHVFIPFVDAYCLLPFALITRPFGDVAWSGIAVHPRFHLASMGAQVPRRKEDWIESFAYRRLLRHRTLDTLLSIDPYFAPYMQDSRVHTVCDPADIASFPQREEKGSGGFLPVAPGAVVLLVYGYIDHRKAVDRLLQVMVGPGIPSKLVVALVGERDPAMAGLLDGPSAQALRAQGRLVDVPRRVSDAEEAAAFARADIVWSYYPGNYCSSGAMVRAGQMGRPLITIEAGLTGLVTCKAGSGLTVPEADDRALAQQLVRLAQDPDLRRALGEAGRRRFADDTGAAFGDRIVSHLSGQAGGSAEACA